MFVRMRIAVIIGGLYLIVVYDSGKYMHCWMNPSEPGNFAIVVSDADSSVCRSC